MGYASRNFSRALVYVKTASYRTVILPELEYAASIWGSDQDSLNNVTESLQKTAARFILGNDNQSTSIIGMESNMQLIFPCGRNCFISA